MKERGFTPVYLIITAILLIGAGAILYKNQYLNSHLYPKLTLKSLANITPSPSSTNYQASPNSNYIKRDGYGRQSGPHDFQCFPDEINNQWDMNLVGFKCDQITDSRTCTTEDDRRLLLTSSTEIRKRHYTCINTNKGDESIVCKSSDNHIEIFSARPNMEYDGSYTEIIYNAKITDANNSSLGNVSWNSEGGYRCLYPIVINRNPLYTVYVRCESGGPPLSVYKLDFGNSKATKLDLKYSNQVCH